MAERRSSPSRLFPLILAITAVLLAGQALWFYLMGEYGRILLPSALSPVLLVAALMALAHHHPSRMAPYMALACGYLLIAVELPRQAGVPLLWIGLPPVLALLLLPLGPAILLNLVLTPIWLALLGDDLLGTHSLTGYLTLVMLAALVPWEHLRQRALLRATDPRDDECLALTRDSLQEQLDGELERARLLDTPFAVLVLHLPQFDMVGEQFGASARRTMLEALTRGVHAHRREHDVLGRVDESSFWLLLPNTSESAALLLRQQLNQSLSQVMLIETGPLQARTRLSLPRPTETTAEFRQRLETATRTLTHG
jgi:diguanylate cyclase